MALLVVAAAAPADDKADLKAAVGKWRVEKGTIGGVDQTALFKDLVLTIQADGKYAVTFGAEKDEGTFTVDSSKSPKQMDITPTGGPNKGKTLRTIYKIDGDTLTVCYQLGEGDRPTAFESKKDTKLFLAVYKREKK
jgi:uncharacterized protein (TIGR03067 family)